jgi:hypothetical protein
MQIIKIHKVSIKDAINSGDNIGEVLDLNSILNDLIEVEIYLKKNNWLIEILLKDGVNMIVLELPGETNQQIIEEFCKPLMDFCDLKKKQLLSKLH